MRGLTDARNGDQGEQQNAAGVADDYQLWTGRNQYQDEHGGPSHEKPQHMQHDGEQNHTADSLLDHTNMSYLNGQQVPQPPIFADNSRLRFINETQDRNSIMSNTMAGGHLNINDITGITRGGEVTVTNDPAMFPPHLQGSVDRYYFPQSPSPIAAGAKHY